MMEMSCGTQTANYALFLQFYGVLRFDDVWNLVGSCFRSGLVFGMCTTTLLKLVLAGMRVVLQFASFLLS